MNIFDTPASTDETWQNCRVALYSHDTMGLGHMRRNLLIAQCFINSPLRANVLMVAGAYAANVFAMPTGVDCLTLPALHKIGNGRYKSRSLDVGLEEIVALRAKTMCAALEAFEPDVLIVDNVPRGAQRELDSTLESLKRRGKTRFVLGLRDVLDAPETVRTEWARAENEAAIRQYYDAIWIYGDPAVHDLARVHNFSPETTAKIRYTGYFDQNKRLEWSPEAAAGSETCAPPEEDTGGDSSKRLVLCLVGGGQDGRQLAETFAQTDLPADYRGLIIAGPFMPAHSYRRLCRAAADNAQLEVIKQVTEPTQLLRAADRVIAMGGYNTVNEILSFGKRALIVPRVEPRQEQLIRAERFRELGLIDCIHPNQVTPEKFAEWLAREPEPIPPVGEVVNMRGLERLPLLLQELIEPSAPFQMPVVKDAYSEETKYVA